jgi:uncharacterized protein
MFVSIYRDHELKGSMGHAMPILPLRRAVVENTQNVAFRDQRFTPLARNELDSVLIDISIPTHPKHVVDISNISICTDGILPRAGFHMWVLLPHAAVKNGWDAEEALMYLSCRAGQGPEDWAYADSLEIFQTEIFREAYLS